MFYVKHKKGGDDDVKIICFIILLILNLVLIICQQLRIFQLENKIHEEKLKAIKEINKIRNGE